MPGADSRGEDDESGRSIYCLLDTYYADQVSPGRPWPSASTRKTAVLVGLLFLTATVAFIFADTLNSGVLSQPDYLTGASAETNALATGALLLFGQFGVVGIAVLLFPLLKPYGESAALAHVGFRVAELAASLFYLAVPLLVIELGAGLRDGAADASASTSLGALCRRNTAWPS